MKRFSIFLVFLSIFFISSINEQPQGKFYYAFDEKIFLTEVPNKVVLTFVESFPLETRQYLQRNPQVIQIELYDEGCILFTAENTNIIALMEDLKNQTGVKSVHPVYKLADFIGTEMYFTDEISVQFKEHVSQQEIDELHKKYHVVVKNHPYQSNSIKSHQILSVPVDADIIEIANAYQESGFVIYSYPLFCAKRELFQSLPADPYFTNQYYLRNTGQTVNGRTCTAGADINVVNAWNITKGSSDIVIAVLDEGVTSNHPDLPNTRQVRLNGSNFATTPPGNDPSPIGNDNHGNACAGIVAASHNSEGIAGIASNCKIMPVRLYDGPILQTSLIRDADAIRFATDKGADVISCSWGYPSNNPNFSPDIVSAIQYATNNGRNRKGCVVVFSAGNTANHAGNNPGFVAFPANVNIAGVLTVGASDRNDFQANYSPTSVLNSPNNQIIDVMAPSHRSYSCHIPGETFDVWTIDIPGNNGYNPIPPITPQLNLTDCGALPVGTLLPNAGINNLAYTAHFGGTSAACPQVAGVAALMLSINPNLTQLQVANIIRSTARKARAGTTYDYQITAGRPNGTWDTRMGYGVLNAYTAVAAANTSITGSATLLCMGSSGTFSVANAPAGFTWNVSSNLDITNTGNNSITVTAPSGSSYYGPGSLGWVGVNINGTEIARKEVWVGFPSVEIDGPEYVSTYGDYSAVYHPLSNVNYFYWFIDVPWPNEYDIFGSGSQIYVYFYNNETYTLYLEASNNCGFGSMNSVYKNIHVYDGRSSPGLVVSYPNPVSDILYVEISGAKSSQQIAVVAHSDPTFDVRLYDDQGKMQRQQFTKGGTLEFNVSTLPNGIYYLHIYDGVSAKPEIHQIVIEH